MSTKFALCCEVRQGSLAGRETSGRLSNAFVLKVRLKLIFRLFKAGSPVMHYQKLRIWLVSFGGFAAGLIVVKPRSSAFYFYVT